MKNVEPNENISQIDQIYNAQTASVQQELDSIHKVIYFVL